MQGLEQLEELAKKLPKDVAKGAQELVERMGSSVEGISDKPIEWKPENMKLIQPTSDRSKLPKAATIGSLVVGEEVLEQPTKVIPLRMWDTRQYWSPDKDDAKLLCSSPDAVVGYIGYECKSCPHAIFDEETKKSPCGKSKTALVASDDLSKVFLINFSKTNFSAGRDWAALMKKAGVAPYKRVYELHTETGAKYKNVESLLVDPAGSTDAGKHEFLKALFDKVSDDRKVHLESFHEMIKKRGAVAGPLLEGPDTSQVLIQHVEETGTAEQSELATKYSL